MEMMHASLDLGKTPGIDRVQRERREAEFFVISCGSDRDISYFCKYQKIAVHVTLLYNLINWIFIQYEQLLPGMNVVLFITRISI